MKQNNQTELPAAESGIRKTFTGKNDWIIKIFCVFAAFILWLYVMEVESPAYETTIGGITVELVGTDVLENQNGLSVYSGRGLPINITVSGKKSIVNKVDIDEIVATADVSEISSAGRHLLGIEVDLPSGLALMQKSQESVTVYVDKADSKVIPIRESIPNMKLPDSYEVGTVSLEYNSINISGPENILSNVAAARVDIDLSNRTSSFTDTCSVYLVDEYNKVITSPYLRYSPTEITVEVPIYKSVTVPVEVSFEHGYLNENNAKISVSPAQVTIKGDESALNVETLLEPIVLDEKKITGNLYERTFPLRTAPGTFIAGASDDVVVNVEVDDSVHIIDVLVTDIEVTGASGIRYEVAEDEILVTLRGPREKLSKLRPHDVYVEVDLSGYSLDTSGTVTKTASVVIDAEDAAELYEVGEYTVQVRIN